jgi:glycosyltransferase involved in cell wall biosynthesis
VPDGEYPAFASTRRQTGPARGPAGSSTLFVSHTGRLGGAELVLLDIVAGFDKGASVFLLEQGPLGARLAQNGTSVAFARGAPDLAMIKRDRSLLRALLYAAPLARAVRDLSRHARRHRVVYANSQKAFVLAAPAAFLARRPLVWHLHDIMSPAHFGAAQRRLVIALANRFAARVIVPSADAADAFTEAGGKPDLVRLVPNGLDLPPGLENPQGLRAAFGLPAGFLFGVFSRLAPWKGQHVAIDALARLPGATCVIAGDALFGEDDYARSLHAHAASLGVADRVIFLGHRTDVPRLMRAMDAVVHPSIDPEPFGRTLVEAMLSGVVVIASACGATRDILDDGRAGLLVPPGDAAALADALALLRAGMPGKAAFVEHAASRARERYGAVQMVARIRAVVEELAA